MKPNFPSTVNDLKKPRKILIIVQRSNGDVFLSLSLINALNQSYKSPYIDLLVNDDTLQIASLLPNVRKIHIFSYDMKTKNRWKQEKELFFNLFNKYDLSINLTSSDRSVIYALIAGRKTISVIEKDNKKSWWKKILLSRYYYYDSNQHIIKQNLTPLNVLGIDYQFIQKSIDIKEDILEKMQKKLTRKGINSFIIFHPSAQYQYKTLPKNSRDELITLLDKLGISILITGANNKIDIEIKNSLPTLKNIFDFIGETTLEEYFALSSLSLAYIGMDTLNMHIASSQNKRIFAIFGPTKLSKWSPWSNQLQTSAKVDQPIQTYGENTVFQADMPCVACGMAGCDNNHGKSECLHNITPNFIFKEVENWYQNIGTQL